MNQNVLLPVPAAVALLRPVFSRSFRENKSCTVQVLKIEVEEALIAAAREDDGGGQACDGLIIDGIDVGEDGVFALSGVSKSFLYQRAGIEFTGGISAGRVTDLVMLSLPSLTGHSRSTFSIWSQKSALVLMRRIKPYLTCRRT